MPEWLINDLVQIAMGLFIGAVFAFFFKIHIQITRRRWRR